MMYRCENCGHLFEEGEQAVWEERHGFDHGPYEEWSGCPICKGDYEEVHRCKECDEWHTEDELYDGWCEKCLRETINYDTFFDYCEADKKTHYLDIFVMAYRFDMAEPDNITLAFHDLMIREYKEIVREANMDFMANSHKKAITSFIMDEDGETGRVQFAEWLNKREGK